MNRIPDVVAASGCVVNIELVVISNAVVDTGTDTVVDSDVVGDDLNIEDGSDVVSSNVDIVVISDVVGSD